MWCHNGTMNTDKPTRERLNLRLPPDLKDQLQSYADTMGIPLNTAAIMALRNYLPYATAKLQPTTPRPKRESNPRPKVTKVVEESAWPSQVVRQHPKVGRNDPCPCGSGRKAKACHPELT